ncbi:MAG: glycosyltransferase family 2 protein [Planctomycetota bacterium]
MTLATSKPASPAATVPPGAVRGGAEDRAVLAEELTVIVPALNEADAIGDVVAELRGHLPTATIMVVDDGSEDDTGQVAASVGARVVRHRRNLGYGASIKTGIVAATTPYVATYDADGQHRPEDLARLLAVAGSYDLVIGARGRNSHRSWLRRPGKWLLARVANALGGDGFPT